MLRKGKGNKENDGNDADEVILSVPREHRSKHDDDE